MHKIIFTQHATPVSDFCAETFIETTINQLLLYENQEVFICNNILIDMLRAKIKSEHKDLIGKVEWFYENEKQNMDNRMRCPTFYKYPVMNILDKALEVLCDLKYYD